MCTVRPDAERGVLRDVRLIFCAIYFCDDRTACVVAVRVEERGECSHHDERRSLCRSLEQDSTSHAPVWYSQLVSCRDTSL